MANLSIAPYKEGVDEGVAPRRAPVIDNQMFDHRQDAVRPARLGKAWGIVPSHHRSKAVPTGRALGIDTTGARLWMKAGRI